MLVFKDVLKPRLKCSSSGGEELKNVRYKSLPMTGFEPRTSGVGSNRSTT